jgi:ribonuclease P protein component
MKGPGKFPRSQRLVLKKDYDRVFSEGRSAADENLVVYVLPTELGHPRLGMAVGKGIGGAAVRNRVKRLIREAFRLNRDKLPESADIVAVARRNVRPELAAITQSLVSLAAGLTREKE